MPHLLVLLAALPAPAAVGRGWYVSTGDNDWLWDSPPVSSHATIQASLTAARRHYGVDRLYWRGFQSELIINQFQIRPDNFLGSAFWRWERELFDQGTSRDAVRIGHSLGMTVWGMTGLFEHGAAPDSDTGKGSGPSVMEDRLRREHPEWVPVDRAGIRRQSGPLELAYPEARRRQVDRYVEQLVRGGYDGLMFYTYVEHFMQRFEEEYGFNDPIVEEYRRRHGVDPRTEPFDAEAWHRLRGEQVTAFLRELSEAMHAKGLKLGLAIDPQESHYPAPWLAVRDVINSGRIWLDWESWVRDGLLDELMVYVNGDKRAAIERAIEVCRGTGCAVSVLQGWDFPPDQQRYLAAGVRCVAVGNTPELEPKVLAAALDGPADGARLTALLRHDDPLVRRQALKQLAETGGHRLAPVIERSLRDEDQAVRCAAAAALLKAHRPESVAALFETVEQRPTFQFLQAAASTLANLPAERTPEILAGAESASASVRRTVGYALGRGIWRPEAREALLAMLADPDAEVRWNAVGALARYRSDEVMLALLPMLDDRHPTVRSRAAWSLGMLGRSNSRWLGPAQLTVLARLERAFDEYGAGTRRPDAGWGWRTIGNALVALGPRGREALATRLADPSDTALADRAWRVLYVPTNGHRYPRMPADEAIASYAVHPSRGGAVPPEPVAEPPVVPYLAQSFDQLPASEGEVGDLYSEVGLLRKLGPPPRPQVQDEVRWGDAGSALRLTRSEGQDSLLYLLRTDWRIAAQPATVSFRARREPGGSVAIWWKDSGVGGYPAGVLLTADGQVRLADGQGGWTPGVADAPEETWLRLVLRMDPAAGEYRAAMGEPGVETPVGAPIPLPARQTYNVLMMAPQGAGGTAVVIDDVRVEVANPAVEETE